MESWDGTLGGCPRLLLECVVDQEHRLCLSSNGYRDPEQTGPAWRRVGRRIADVRHLGWDIGVRAMARASGQHHSERLDFRLAASARDLLAEKGRAVRDEMESLAQSVMRAGSYPAREEATRAFHAAMDALKDRVPPDVLLKLSEHLPEVEAIRLRESLHHRLDH